MKRYFKFIFLSTFMMAIMVSNFTVFAGYKDVEIKVEEIKFDENGNRIINYDEAIEMATKENSSLKELSDTMEFIDYSRSMMYSQNIVPDLPGNGNYLVTAARFQKLATLNSLNVQEKNLKLSEDLTKLSIEASVKGSMTTISTLEKNYNLAKEGLEIAREQLAQSGTMYRIGMLSKIDYEKMIKDVSNKEQELKQLEMSINQEYNSLKRLIGLNDDEQFKIEYDVKFEPIDEVSDMPSYVNRKIQSDLGLQIERATLDSANFGFNMFIDNGDGTEYEKRKLDYANSERNYKQNVKNKENSIKNSYIGLKNIETERKVLENKLEQAKADYEIAKINYELGNITKLQYDTSHLAITQAQVALEQNTLTHDINKFMLDNTCLISDSTSMRLSK